jgi:Na+-translocating ferredoxin:NAD+ oxidoreductase RnfG subunit
MNSRRNIPSALRTGARRRLLWVAACLSIVATVAAGATDERVQSAIHAAFPGATVTEHKVGISSAARAELGDAAKAHLAPRWRWRYLAISDPGRGVVGVGGTWKTTGRHGRIEILVLADPQCSVVSVTILKHREQRGRGIVRASFLDQFRRKTLAGRWQLGQDVDGITGATVSSRAVTSGVHNCLVYLRKFSLPSP